MRPVIYSMSVSLDGFIAGPDGDIGWTVPSAEVFRFHVEQTRTVAAQLCGRGLYETMLFWENAELTDEAELEFARLWKPLPKVVFSRTLTSVEGTARLATDDVATEVARLRAQPDDGIVAIGGAGLAADAIAGDLIDEYRQFVYPIVVGDGTPFFPPLVQPLGLRLVESREMGSGVVYLRYQRLR
ncbi:dihydrofolate reductase family protein [Amycolatopsis sp. NBC_01480]|uniref:dihydrofolate reductase family protein n=1 Tax=Amycolatopsis sp. NBC_01480 TaxID=2903562 RepID=UPI002E28CD08|nr:dihydrofolate reductase family protein [Amycolatopsis sp. NBC_01480]